MSQQPPPPPEESGGSSLARAAAMFVLGLAKSFGFFGFVILLMCFSIGLGVGANADVAANATASYERINNTHGVHTLGGETDVINLSANSSEAEAESPNGSVPHNVTAPVPELPGVQQAAERLIPESAETEPDPKVEAALNELVHRSMDRGFVAADAGARVGYSAPPWVPVGLIANALMVFVVGPMLYRLIRIRGAM